MRASLTASLPPRWRVPLLVLAFVALVTGVGAGLSRFGWAVPAGFAASAAMHGPLLLCCFFGAVVALERAVAIDQAWAYAAPLLAVAGGLAAIGGSISVAAALTVLAAAMLVVASTAILRRQRQLFTGLLAVGAGCWLIGSLSWLAGVALYIVVSWWFAFLVLTIAAERLELARFLRPSPVATRVFMVIVTGLIVGLAFGAQHAGRALSGVAIVSLAAWLVRQDLARRTIRTRGLTRYIAACLLAGYAWLALAGALIAGADAWMPGSPARDAALHALGLGFVFSMVFGHAPIIVPAVLRIATPYSRAFYLPLLLLHGSVILRVMGDAIDYSIARWGALGNALAIATFVVTMLTAVTRGRLAAATRR